MNAKTLGDSLRLLALRLAMLADRLARLGRVRK